MNRQWIDILLCCVCLSWAWQIPRPCCQRRLNEFKNSVPLPALCPSFHWTNYLTRPSWTVCVRFSALPTKMVHTLYCLTHNISQSPLVFCTVCIQIFLAKFLAPNKNSLFSFSTSHSCSGSGSIKSTDLPAVMLELGLHLSDADVARLLHELGLGSAAQPLTFAHFVKSLYLLQADHAAQADAVVSEELLLDQQGYYQDDEKAAAAAAADEAQYGQYDDEVQQGVRRQLYHDEEY